MPKIDLKAKVRLLKAKTFKYQDKNLMTKTMFFKAKTMLRPRMVTAKARQDFLAKTEFKGEDKAMFFSNRRPDFF